jgi:plastocyanin
MRHRLGSRVLFAASVLVSGSLLACGGDLGTAAGERLASVGATASGSAAGSGAGSGDGGAPLEDVVVMSGPEADVEARDNTFDAENIQVAPGTRVVWTNDGRQDHDIVPVDDGGWGVEPEGFAPDDVYEHTFDEPGTYRYYCSLHGTAEAGMTGAVVVAE